FIGWGLAVAEAVLDGPREIAVVGPSFGPVDPASGPAGDVRAAELHRTALLATAPGAVVAAGTPGSDEFPLLADRPLVAGQAAAYVCRHFVCAAPTTEVTALKSELGAFDR
ncbi:hypothetical protein GT042_37785, partial [Streptomyces sp. SID3212]|nr:hypothetical protein [Streptomyces sp. SID3212]